MNQAMFDPDLGQVWIPTKRGMFAAATLFCVALAGVASWLAISAEALGHVGWFAFAALNAGCAVVIGYRFISKGGLRLDQKGFAMVARSRPVKSFQWSEVHDFKVVETGSYGNKFVGFDINGQVQRGQLHRLGRAMSGVDMLLPSFLSIRPAELVSVMEAWRSRYAKAEQTGAAERS